MLTTQKIREITMFAKLNVCFKHLVLLLLSWLCWDASLRFLSLGLPVDEEVLLLPRNDAGTAVTGVDIEVIGVAGVAGLKDNGVVLFCCQS